MKNSKTAVFVAAIALTAAGSLQASSAIYDSAFGRIGAEFNIDPLLLYAVALTESGHGSQGHIAPHPYALRVASLPGAYPRDRAAAERQLQEWLASYRSIDVGLMQVNLRWHGHRVSDPTALLDVETNIRVGAQILSEAMASHDDPYIGIGRYYTYSDDNASRRYGERVVHFYQNLQRHAEGGQ